MHEMREANGSGMSLFAFLAGAVIGVGVGLLVAPRPGSETRRQLADFAQKTRDRVGEVASKMRRTAENSEEDRQQRYGA